MEMKFLTSDEFTDSFITYVINKYFRMVLAYYWLTVNDLKL